MNILLYLTLSTQPAKSKQLVTKGIWSKDKNKRQEIITNLYSEFW